MNSRIKVLKGDITKIKADAIVNAANSSLMGGGGVDGAIHRAGGLEILEACREIARRQGGCKTGEAVITTAGNLPAKYVIHTVGPVWNGGINNEPVKLTNCYRNSLQLALQHSCKIVVFPNISTGIYGYPKAEAAKIAVETVLDFIETTDKIDEVLFVCFDEENFQLISREIDSSLHV